MKNNKVRPAKLKKRKSKKICTCRGLMLFPDCPIHATTEIAKRGLAM